MKKILIKYIKEEINKLKYKGDSINLDNVYPSILEEVLGDFEKPYELNGYDCDYWVETGKYSISGCMRYGTATIELIIDDDKPKLENSSKDINEFYNKREDIIPDEAK